MSKSITPFESFLTIWNAQELLDYAFKNCERVAIQISKRLPMLEKIKKKEVNRLRNVLNYLTNKIKAFIASVPNLDELPEFYRRLSNLLVNNDEMRKHLGALNGSIKILKMLYGVYSRKIISCKSADDCAHIRMEYFGRVSSVIKDQDENLKFLDECRNKLMKVPFINLSMPAVVVAGYPNVGKSSIVGKISSARPMVAEYPFTTKQIFIGVYEDKFKSQYFQVIDTPGILDRPMAERNNIEQQAILALNIIASIVLFVFDPTPASGFEVESQLHLYNEVKTNFLAGTSLPIKIIVNKIDLATQKELNSLVEKLNVPKDEIIFTNGKDGVNIEQIVKYLLEFFRERNFKR